MYEEWECEDSALVKLANFYFVRRLPHVDVFSRSFSEFQIFIGTLCTFKTKAASGYSVPGSQAFFYRLIFHFAVVFLFLCFCALIAIMCADKELTCVFSHFINRTVDLWRKDRESKQRWSKPMRGVCHAKSMPMPWGEKSVSNTGAVKGV